MPPETSFKCGIRRWGAEAVTDNPKSNYLKNHMTNSKKSPLFQVLSP
jgi:hypothetical protein